MGVICRFTGPISSNPLPKEQIFDCVQRLGLGFNHTGCCLQDELEGDNSRLQAVLPICKDCQELSKDVAICRKLVCLDFV